MANALMIGARRASDMTATLIRCFEVRMCQRFALSEEPRGKQEILQSESIINAAPLPCNHATR
jgi:hypothetical protein